MFDPTAHRYEASRRSQCLGNQGALLAVFVQFDAVKLRGSELFIRKRFQNKRRGHANKSTGLDEHNRAQPARQSVKRWTIKRSHHAFAAVSVSAANHVRHELASPNFLAKTR